jgi:hypothetical protein
MQRTATELAGLKNAHAINRKTKYPASPVRIDTWLKN